MAQSTFIRSGEARVYSFTKHVTNIATFQTAVNADFPELGGNVELLHTTADATTAILILPSGKALRIPLNSWLGKIGDDWEVWSSADMAGPVYHPYTP